MPEEIFVGRKPIKTYFIRASFILSKQNEVFLVTRGALISKALVVAKRLKDVAGFDFNVEKIDFEELTSNNRKKTVPSVSIKVYRKS